MELFKRSWLILLLTAVVVIDDVTLFTFEFNERKAADLRCSPQFLSSACWDLPLPSPPPVTLSEK